MGRHRSHGSESGGRGGCASGRASGFPLEEYWNRLWNHWNQSQPLLRAVRATRLLLGQSDQSASCAAAAQLRICGPDMNCTQEPQTQLRTGWSATGGEVSGLDLESIAVWSRWWC